MGFESIVRWQQHWNAPCRCELHEMDEEENTVEGDSHWQTMPPSLLVPLLLSLKCRSISTVNASMMTTMSMSTRSCWSARDTSVA